MPLRSARRIANAVLACTVAATSLPAQIGSVIRRAAGAPAASNDQNATITVPPEQRISAATLDQLEAGLNAQIAALNAAKQQPANVKSPDAYQQCMTQALMGPDAQKIVQDFGAASDAANGNTDKMTLAMQKYTSGLQAIVSARCGPDPATSRTSAQNAATAAEQKGQAASGFTPTLWAIFKERIPPFCNLPAAKRGSGDVRADGKYVYLASEAATLAPRCTTLMAKLSAIN